MVPPLGPGCPISRDGNLGTPAAAGGKQQLPKNPPAAIGRGKAATPDVPTTRVASCRSGKPQAAGRKVAVPPTPRAPRPTPYKEITRDIGGMLGTGNRG